MSTIIPSKEISQQREHKVWELRVRCYSQAQIAEELNITQGAVSQILKRVRTRLADQFAKGVAEMRAEQTEQLMRVAMEALAAWEQSKHESASALPEVTAEPIHTATAQQTAPSDVQSKIQNLKSKITTPDTSKQSAVGLRGTAATFGGHPTPSRNHTGKAAYLRAAIKALADVRALWNLDDPDNLALKSAMCGTKIIVGIDYDHMKDPTGRLLSRKEVERIEANNEALAR